MEKRKLEGFYESWSSKSPAAIAYDIEAAVRKADVIASGIPAALLRNIHTVLDFGCGYGALVHRFTERLTAATGIGIDFSAAAIDVARQKFEGGPLRYHRLPSLDIGETADFLRSTIPAGVDCILLIDLLEHVPDCKGLVASLAQFTQYFIVKLPIESSVFDNYVLPKEYPSSVHSNGHLREFHANNVYYFVRELGLTPLYEALYVYHADDMFAPLPPGTLSLRHKLIRGMLRMFKLTAAWVLPRKLFLRVIGGGGYFCLATYDQAHVLNP